MKRKTKRILGSCGLLIVGLVTIFAAFLPAPKTSATGSVTDTIKIRVVPSHPEVQISGITDGTVFVTPGRTFKVSYSGATEVKVVVEYRTDGNEYKKTLDAIETDYETGERTYSVNLKSLTADSESMLFRSRSQETIRFGYGDYTVRATVDGAGGETDFDVVNFSYIPVIATLSEDDNNDHAYHVGLEYDHSDNDIKTIVVTVYDEDGRIVAGPKIVENGENGVDFEFADKIPTGNYTVEVVAKDEDGDQLYTPYEIEFRYEKIDVPGTGTPATGVFSGNLNIAKSDYLITGVIIFGIIAVAGFVFVAKGNKQKSKKR